MKEIKEPKEWHEYMTKQADYMKDMCDWHELMFPITSASIVMEQDEEECAMALKEEKVRRKVIDDKRTLLERYDKHSPLTPKGQLKKVAKKK